MAGHFASLWLAPGRWDAASPHSHNRLGLQVAVVADIAQERINQAYADLGLDAPLISNDIALLNVAIASGKPAGTTDSNIVPLLDVDVVVEATGVAEIGAQVIYNTLINKKHSATLNVECDVTVGPMLRETAKEKRSALLGM